MPLTSVEQHPSFPRLRIARYSDGGYSVIGPDETPNPLSPSERFASKPWHHHECYNEYDFVDCDIVFCCGDENCKSQRRETCTPCREYEINRTYNDDNNDDDL